MAGAKTLYVVIVVLIAGLLVSATLAAVYLFQYDQAQSNANTYLSELKSVQPTQTTDILLDFGNGTLLWHNDTQVQTGANAYVATVIVAHGVVNATWYEAPYNEHLVTGIDNVQNTAQQSWFIWTYNSTASWRVAQVGADELPAITGSVFAWTYCNYNSTTYAPSCTP
jgi:hypothetical protein